MLSKISADKKKLQEKQRNAAAAESRKAQERLIPQSREHMEWGWSAYEERQRLARRFILWDGFVAIIATVQFSLTSFFASFDPYNESLLWASGMLDYLFLVDICVNVYKFYIFDQQNADLRIGNSRLDNYLYGWFIADILAILPTDSISIMTYNPYNFYDFDLPLLAICRANRLLVGYKIFLVNYFCTFIRIEEFRLRGIILPFAENDKCCAGCSFWTKWRRKWVRPLWPSVQSTTR